MPKNLVGIIAATLVAAVLGVTGAGIAAAQSSTPTLAQQVQQGRDRLAAAWQADDADAVRSAVSDLAPVLASVRQNLGRDTMNPQTAMYLGRAEQQRSDLAAALSAPQPRDGILGAVGNLVGGLLDSLSNLLNGLLGGGSGDQGSGSGPADGDGSRAAA
jgi:hypothetical protein